MERRQLLRPSSQIERAMYCGGGSSRTHATGITRQPPIIPCFQVMDEMHKEAPLGENIDCGRGTTCPRRVPRIRRERATQSLAMMTSGPRQSPRPPRLRSRAGARRGRGILPAPAVAQRHRPGTVRQSMPGTPADGRPRPGPPQSARARGPSRGRMAPRDQLRASHPSSGGRSSHMRVQSR